MGIFGNRSKLNKPKTEMETKRKYRVQHGLPQELLNKLKELYEFLTIKDAMDARGFVMTDYKELKEVSGISNVFLTTIIREKIILKEPVGRAYKYKWDSIYPTLDMSVKTIEMNYQYRHITPEPEEEIVPEAKPEIVPEPEPEPEEKPTVGEFVSLIDYRTEDNVMTVRINLQQFEVKEADVIASVMALLVKK